MSAGARSAHPLVAASVKAILRAQDPGGAIVASRTFPQYRYAWFRDGAFAAEALDLAGRTAASRAFHDWVARLVLARRSGIERSISAAARGEIPDESDYLHCRYRVDGSPGPEWGLFQLDGPGIWLWSLRLHADLAGDLDREHLAAAALVAEYLAALARLPCNDAWEEHADRVHTATLGAILAGSAAAREIGVASAHTAIAGLERTIREGSGAYTKWAGSDEVDASLLWLAAPYGVVDPHERRFAATLERIERELVGPDGGVHRYRSDTYYGGGEWPLLASALGRVYLRRGDPGDRARAQRSRSWIESCADGHLALPEQDPRHALHPERVEEWRTRWGPVARPLVWSHAAYVALCHELDDTEVSERHRMAP